MSGRPDGPLLPAAPNQGQAGPNPMFLLITCLDLLLDAIAARCIGGDAA